MLVFSGAIRGIGECVYDDIIGNTEMERLDVVDVGRRG